MEILPSVFPRPPWRIARLFWQRGLAMATRELEGAEGAERQVLRYRFAVRKLSPVHSLKARCSSGGFICWENTWTSMSECLGMREMYGNVISNSRRVRILAGAVDQLTFLCVHKLVEFNYFIASYSFRKITISKSMSFSTVLHNFLI